MQARVLLVSALSAAVVTAAFPRLDAPPVAALTVLTFAPSDDATVRADRPGNNYGSDATLAIDGSPEKRAYLKFSVSGIGAQTVQSAVLRIYNVDRSNAGGVLQPTQGGWDEGTITWDNAPPVDPSAIASLGKVSPGTWYDLDLTAFVTGDGTLNVAFTSGAANGADYASRESGPGTAPQLIVTAEDVQPDGEAPSQPTGLAAVAESPSSVSLSWGASSDNVGVVGYDIYRDSSAITTAASTSFVDTGVVGETTYEYTVVARDAAGNASAASDPVTVTTPAGAPVILAAGDIAGCASSGDEATAELLDGLEGTVITLGDNAYINGTSDEFATCYDPTWGRQLGRTMPAPGNHDYYTADAAGYYGYFGAAAGDRAQGWYAYTRGTWRIIVLNSNCADAGGCGYGSAQDLWLQDELATHADMNVLAYWHHPRFSSGTHGNDATYEPFWQRLYDAGADLVLNGHDHDYERFAPQGPAGTNEPAYGIREFVVGTGGIGLGAPGVLRANSEVWDSSSFGVLKLTLLPDAYDWEFIPVAGGGFTDAGHQPVHAAPPTDVSPPSVPTGLTTTAITESAVELAWDPSTDDLGAVSYEVLRGATPIGQAIGTSFVDSAVLAGGLYDYQVRARDSAGNWSAPSDPLWVSTPLPPSSLNLDVTSDATIRPDHADRNYGSAATLEVDASSEKNFLLAATIGDLGGQQVVSATLYLYCVDSSDNGGDVYRTADGWDEQTVTWGTAPPTLGTPVASIGPVISGSWYAIDLSSVITGPGTFSFRVTSPSSNGADYVSSEGTLGFTPLLVLELGQATP